MTLALLAVLFVVLGGALLVVRHLQSRPVSTGASKPRQARRSLLDEHVRQLTERMHFDRIAVGADGRAAVGFLPRSRRLVFVGPAWIDGTAAQRGELRAFDVGPEDLVDAEVEQQTWTHGGRNGDGTPRARSVTLRVVVRDTDAPMHLVEFLSEDAVLGSDVHLDAVRSASRWEGLVRALAADAAREAALSPLVEGMSEEERKREHARQLAGKVLAQRDRKAALDEAELRQVRPTP